MKNENTEKLQKVLARAGLGSRRQMEEWITDGRVKINGKTATLGDRVTEDCRIHVDNKPLAKDAAQPKECRVIIYNKPEGEICSRNDPEGRPTVFEQLPRLKNQRWISVGRLDINSSGLLLFTNDGELANQLMHPSSNIEREYAVRVYGEVDADMLKRLRKGVKLDDGMASFKRIKDAGGDGKNHWYHVVICEGRQREVRRLWESQDIQVSRLIRLRYGPISLPRNLARARWRALTERQVARLLEDYN